MPEAVQLLRASGAHRAVAEAPASPFLTVRGLTLEPADMSVSYKDKKAELTKNETRILACLMKRELCTKEEIFEDFGTTACMSMKTRCTSILTDCARN